MKARTSIDEDKFVQVQDHPAGVRQAVLAGMIGQGSLFRRGRQAAKGQPAGGGGLLGNSARVVRPARQGDWPGSA